MAERQLRSRKSDRETRATVKDRKAATIRDSNTSDEDRRDAQSHNADCESVENPSKDRGSGSPVRMTSAVGLSLCTELWRLVGWDEAPGTGSQVCDEGRGQLACLHGVRALSCLWVVLQHSFVLFAAVPSVLANPELRYRLTQRWWMAPAYSPMAMENFFLLSGLLAARSFHRRLRIHVSDGDVTGSQSRHDASSEPAGSGDGTGSRLRAVGLYLLHRFLRLTPPLAATIALYTFILPLLIPHPDFPTYANDRVNCYSQWWATVAHVVNLRRAESACLIWSWSTSLDVQFHVAGLVVLLLWASRSGFCRRLGTAVCLGLLVLPAVCTVTLNLRDVSMSLMAGPETMAYLRRVYFAPWCRVGSFALGLVLGRASLDPRGPPLPRLFHSRGAGWGLALPAAFVSLFLVSINVQPLYATGAFAWSDRAASCYEAASRAVWAGALAWVVLACSRGHGGVVNRLLSWRGWVPLSRLSYGVYLTHSLVFYGVVHNMARPVTLTPALFVALFVVMALASLPLSLGLAVLVERPVHALEARLLARWGRRRSAVKVD